MRYRAILVDKPEVSHRYGTEVQNGSHQITGNDMLTICEWAEKILAGRAAPARVLIYENKEILVNSVFANGHPTSAFQQES